MRLFALSIFMAVATAAAAEYHVSVKGDDRNRGTLAKPFRTIQQAANLAQPGDIITVHAGVYRERINPPRGGTSDSKRIVYRAAPGEPVEIKGSEAITNWVKLQDDVWQTTLPNSFFGSFNPYNDLIHGDWFRDKGRKHHTGAVYLNGEWLTEAATLDDVLKPATANALWFAIVGVTNTAILAQFKDVDPNKQLVEINVRRTVFYPEKTGVNFITVRGFILRQAATPWSPPTAEQIGLIGTHWSKGWIIEKNTISHSICSGVSLGKYGDEFDNTSANTAEGYVKTVEGALANGWNKSTVGGHIVRDNDISYCEQTGIVGSLGCSFSTITGNTIHDIHVRRLFTGDEMAGIKFHGAIDVQITHNHIYRTIRGIWLDWMAQGARVSGNLFHENASEDLFFEVDHGPFLVENNIFLSRMSLLTLSQGGAFAHNLFAGGITVNRFDRRLTPFHKPHSTELAGMHDNPNGDDRFYNNLFLARGDLSQYDTARLPVWMNGNVFLKGTKPSKYETNPLLKPGSDPALKFNRETNGWFLEMKFDPSWNRERTRPLVTTKLLGRAAIPNAAYEQPDGRPIRLDTDYFGKRRSGSNPSAGPFANPGPDVLRLNVWPEPNVK